MENNNVESICRSILKKELEQLDFLDSHKILLELRELQHQVVKSDLPKDVKSFRKKGFKKYLEGRQSALFCYGMGLAVLKTSVSFAFAPEEASEYDCVAKWCQDGDPIFTKIQLKELVPEHLNPQTTLNNELNKLTKYDASKDLVVAFHINRRGQLDLSAINVDNLKVAEIWLFGALSDEQDKWFLYGNLLASHPKCFEFEYPIN